MKNCTNDPDPKVDISLSQVLIFEHDILPLKIMPAFSKDSHKEISMPSKDRPFPHPRPLYLSLPCPPTQY